MFCSGPLMDVSCITVIFIKLILPPLLPTNIIVQRKTFEVPCPFVVSITDIDVIPRATCELRRLCGQLIREVSIAKITKTNKRLISLYPFTFYSSYPSRWFVEDSSSIKTFKSPPAEFLVILIFSMLVRSVLHCAILPNRSDKLILVLALSAEKTTPSLDSLLLEDDELERDRLFCFGSSSILIRWIGIC